MTLTESEVLMLGRKLDEALAIVSDTRVQVSEVAVNLKSHIERDGERKEERELTCPIKPLAARNMADIDKLGGLMREARTDIDGLLVWQTQENKDDLIIASRVGPLRSVGKWAALNFNNILVTMLIAYLLVVLKLR